jgi:hypothetical protein
MMMVRGFMVSGRFPLRWRTKSVILVWVDSGCSRGQTAMSSVPGVVQFVAVNNQAHLRKGVVAIDIKRVSVRPKNEGAL